MESLQIANRYLAEVKEWGNRANAVLDRIELRNELAVEERPNVQNPDEPNEEDFVSEGEKENEE